MTIRKEIMDYVMNIDNPDRFKEQEDNIEYLKAYNKEEDLKLYLFKLFRNLYIERDINYNPAMLGGLYCMYNDLLNGECYNSTTSFIPFLKDTDRIERGTIRPDSKQIISHSWIYFIYNNKEYILDTGIGFVVPLEVYLKIYKPEVKGKVTSKEVKEAMIDYFISGEKNRNGFYHLPSSNDINDPFYYTGISALPKYSKTEIKKLSFKYRENC